MAQGDQLGGALGCLDAGDPRNLQRIAFGIVRQRRQRFGRERDEDGGFRFTARGRFAADVHHPGLAGVIEMGELAHRF